MIVNNVLLLIPARVGPSTVEDWVVCRVHGNATAQAKLLNVVWYTWKSRRWHFGKKVRVSVISVLKNYFKYKE